jgi:hypothetical protein
MKLLEAQNPEILRALTSPENIKNLAEAIGLDDFKIPGQDDVEKQYEEIRLLINSEPIIEPPSEEQMLMAMTQGQEPQPNESPSVEIDYDLDNHQVESDICRSYLISAAGRLLKTENPDGYKNVLLHMKAHLEAIRLKMMEEMQAQMGPAAGAGNPKLAEQPPGSNQPLTENANVSTQA